MIIPLEIALIAILAVAGWFQSRWLFLLFAAGEIFVIAELIISIISAVRTQVSLRPFAGSVRLGHTTNVRVSVRRAAFAGAGIKIRAYLTSPSGRKQKIRYKEYITDAPLSLPVSADSVGEMTFTITSVSFSDAAGFFLFFKKVNKSVTIPVVPDPEKKTEVIPDETERKLLEEKTQKVKGDAFSRDEIRSYREYRNGDEKRDIHWNISARLGKYYIKEFEGGSEEIDAGNESEPGRYATDSDANRQPSLLSDIKRKKVHRKKLRRLPRKQNIFTILLRGITAAAVSLVFLVQMTRFSHPFIFDAGIVSAAVIVTAAVLTVSQIIPRLRWLIKLVPLAIAALVFITHTDVVINSVTDFVKWLAGSYKYTDSSPYVSLTLVLTIAGIILTEIIFLLLRFRISVFIVLSGAVSVFCAEIAMKAEDSAPTVSACLLVAIALVLAYMLISRVDRDFSYVIGILTATGSAVFAIFISGVMPQITSGDIASRSAVLSGEYADERMNDIYEAENQGIERFAQLYKINYRVPFDGQVGQQLNQFTGETQLIVSSQNPSYGQDLYIRFYSGRKYNNGSWTGGDPQELTDKCWDEAAQILRLNDAEKETAKNNAINYFSGGIYTYLQYQESMYTRNGMAFDSYEVGNAVPKGYNGTGLSYDLTKISIPMGMGGGTDKTYYASAADLAYCSADVSHTLDSIKYFIEQYDYWDTIRRSDTPQSQEISTTALMCEMIDRYQKNYAKYYLEVPDGLDRMRQLVEDEPLDDLEEITAYIRYILASHASYSLQARDPIGSTDPIEYFLFNSHRGYCEQYASAACILYRMYGIPARYVSGYRVSPSDFDSDGEAKVPDSKAHAWVEIYYPSTGWIPVEMTPAEIPSDAADDVTGYPTDSTATIWPEFTEEDLYDIQKENGWTGRIFKVETEEDDTESTQNTAASEEQTESEQEQASADASETDESTQDEEKDLWIVTFINSHRTLVLWILVIIIVVAGIYAVLRIIEYRFRHAGLVAISKRTDHVITHAKNFAIPLSKEESEEFTWYFRLLEKAIYGGYRGTAEEIARAYDVYDKLMLTLFFNKSILFTHYFCIFNKKGRLSWKKQKKT